MSKKQGNPCHPQINPATDPNVVAIKKKKRKTTRQIITKNSKKVFFVMFKSVPAPPKTKRKVCERKKIIID